MARAGSGLEVFVAGLPQTPPRHLSVDGMTPDGPNLSHWPGNRTPAEFKADLSTGICLRFARAPESVRREFLASVEGVVNDHYDTDGFLSMLAIVRPEVALPRERLCLAAAATGDYQRFETDHGFAVDRIVRELPRSSRSPIRSDLAGLSPDETSQACYRWLIENAETVLDRPETFRALYEEELEQVAEELRRAHGGELDVRRHQRVGLAVLRSRRPFHRMVLNTCAGAYRVLHIVESTDGWLYRYHDRTESWFEVVTFAPPTRRDLRPLRTRLQRLEGEAGVGPAQWCADPLTDPVPELYHGLAGVQEYGEITRTLSPSRLGPDEVSRCAVEYFADQRAGP